MDFENTLSEILQRKPEEINKTIVDELLQYSEDMQKHDLEFLMVAADKIKDSTITWKRPWYQMATSVKDETYLFKDIQKHETETFKFNSINWTRDEKAMLLKNWNELRDKYNLSDQPVSLFRCKSGKTSLKTSWYPFWMFMLAYLARGLPRTLYQLYQQGKKQFIYKDKADYTATEEKIVEIFLKHCHSVKNPLLEINRILRRPVVRSTKKKGNNEVPKKWSLDKASMFLRHLMRNTHMPLEDLKGIIIDHNVWRVLGKLIGYNEINLSRFWYSQLHVQLFVKEDIHLRKLLKKLFTILKDSHYKKWSQVDWHEVTKHFPEGCTWWFLYFNAIKPFRKTWANKKYTVAEAADIFLQKKMHLVKERRLKRVVFVKGHLKYLTKDDEK